MILLIQEIKNFVLFVSFVVSLLIEYFHSLGSIPAQSAHHDWKDVGRCIEG
jgi:hypothetical protein